MTILDQSGLRVHITGIVQGVGFRPFVYNLAIEHKLNGWVRNTAAGVDIEVDGDKATLENFAHNLQHKAPPLSQIDVFTINWIAPQNFTEFKIVHSEDDPGAFIPISPDVTICEDCINELFDHNDRRFRYPFINCTNCGPRFTIIKEIPYDRPFTTMSGFPLCPECEAEYTDPANRRFHAQPVACDKCGPHVWLEASQNEDILCEKDEAICTARKLLQEGKILAIKGLGGFHLACDATNSNAVKELRHRKLRVDKPFAVMLPNMKSIQKYCRPNHGEEKAIESRERPIVVIPQLEGNTISEYTAPGQKTLGVMLPYTPLHALLLEPNKDFPEALVMTSGNLSEEPLAYSNEEARKRLSGLADYFLMHNRDIYIRCDDSVVRVVETNQHPNLYPIRRSRGFAPNPIRLQWKMPQILAAGAELKNTFCLTKDQYAFLSHHIGDLENFETLQAYEHGFEHYKKLFRIQPEYLAFDLHPNYLATRYIQEFAQTNNLPAFGIQHHHAHIAACMADNKLEENAKVIGLSFDGTGYGTDGTIWGGEVLISAYRNFKRAFYLKPFPLPGGDAATKEPWRIALAWLHQAGLNWDEYLPPVSHATPSQKNALLKQIKLGTNSPMTSSMGRLFDAVAALIGIRQTVNYEGQAAIELESAGDHTITNRYDFEIADNLINPTPMFGQIVGDLKTNTSIPEISAKFHNTIAEMAVQSCIEVQSNTGINTVALSGGVWQNTALFQRSMELMKKHHFTVLHHHKIPTNDGGIALGQAVITFHTINQ